MKGLAFFDANVLIYADDVSAKGKRERAISLIVEHRRNKSLVTSLRVLREYYAAATRKRASQRKLRSGRSRFSRTAKWSASRNTM
jgi:predicted nucleic acid-binding protein